MAVQGKLLFEDARQISLREQDVGADYLTYRLSAFLLPGLGKGVLCICQLPLFGSGKG